ncbi:serine/threonine protein kinase [Arthrobacter agilis]|uniref:serine/threonine-protein kinase n=1 Tax=Arthrobacter agilis TaxID=37921 RepID=UPI000B34AE54|nr:serine/threonine-protein kinase [Arthrobacter agilis]OUM40462.1 hypothetical protein B8W74_13160 [Arthrobacter agilis]PPB45076.1 serine/threonine protein kinase [Arthrobacter agilis]TPV27780.1 serine/threonine protein kinase [Arthrobacter agilis]VDR31567.1 Serine/threonine-protein kinase pknB [Arthrobacter agilis]
MEQQVLAERYALGERVGTGGMADVFVARDVRLDRDVAVKLFRPGTADGLDRGSAEARMLAGLDHPGLVRVLDMDNGDHGGDGAYLVMELIRGSDLGVLLRSVGSMPREEARTMALDITRTLDYIHGRGIVHRDIKPSNILTRDADPDSGVFRFLLTDFGIARFFDGGRMTATGQVIGSAAYFSPEQARGDDVGQASDIYSLALVLIEALTGERAFPGTGVESALARLHRAPSIPHAAGPGLSELLVSMTLDQPDDRPDAGAVLSALIAMGVQPAEPGTRTASPADDGCGPEAHEDSHHPGSGARETSYTQPSYTQPNYPVSSGPDPDPDDRVTALLEAAPARTRVTRSLADDGSADTREEPSARTARLAGTRNPGEVHAESDGGRGLTVNEPDGRSPHVMPDGSIEEAPDGKDGPGGSGPGRRRGETAGTSSTLRGPAPEERRATPDAPRRDPARPDRSRPSGRRNRRVLTWLLALLGVVLLAAGVWVFTTLSQGDADPTIEPLPSVPGEPGERLQELYESVQP